MNFQLSCVILIFFDLKRHDDARTTWPRIVVRAFALASCSHRFWFDSKSGKFVCCVFGQGI